MAGFEEEKKLVDVIVPAAGRGKRMQCDGNKMFQPVNGVPIIYRTLYRLSQMKAVNRIILVIRESEKNEFDKLFDRFGELKKKWVYVQGGAERYDSVRNGCQYILSNLESDLVMTHDGARPFLTEALLNRLIEQHERGAIAVPVQSVTETVRTRDEEGRTSIIDRNRLFLIQTPQLFHAEDIEECFLSGRQADLRLTDEAGYFESLGLPVRLVEGDKRNIKITTPEDLVWAEFLLKRDDALKLNSMQGQIE